MKTEEESEHPSYGIVSFSRVTGNPGTLFGSKLGNHESYIELRVSRCKLIVDSSGEERVFGPMRGELIEVKMSAAQFSELITTMNIGMGVPCTISRVNLEEMERPPAREVESVRTRGAFKRTVESATRRASQLVEEARVILDKKSLLKSDREELMRKMEGVVMEIRQNAPFMFTIFEEAAEKVAKAAKAEVDNMLTHNLITRGLKAYAEEGHTPKLPAGSEEVQVLGSAEKK